MVLFESFKLYDLWFRKWAIEKCDIKFLCSLYEATSLYNSGKSYRVVMWLRQNFYAFGGTWKILMILGELWVKWYKVELIGCPSKSLRLQYSQNEK